MHSGEAVDRNWTILTNDGFGCYESDEKFINENRKSYQPSAWNETNLPQTTGRLVLTSDLHVKERLTQVSQSTKFQTLSEIPRLRHMAKIFLLFQNSPSVHHFC